MSREGVPRRGALLASDVAQPQLLLRSRSWAGRRLTWEKYHQIKARAPLLKPKLRLPYAELQALAVL